MEEVRRQLIEMLTFPRLLALKTMELDDCRHGGRFQSRDPTCRTCDFMYQCTWLESNEPFVELAQRPLTELIRALRFSIDYVDSQNHRGNQPSSKCVCETCRWLGNAQRLVRQAEGKTEVVHAH